MKYEHLRVLLDSEESLDLLYVVLQFVARAEVPEEAAAALTQSSLVALQKPDGGLQGIAVGEVLRRVVATTLAKQYSEEIERAYSPF